MSSRSCDLLITNVLVLTMDEAYHRYSSGAVAISGDSIVAVGPEAEMRAAYAPAETFDGRGKVLMPGLVNAHTHAAMTLQRGLADDRRLDVWLMGYMMPVEKEFVSPDYCRLGTQIACAEMIRSGVTSFADMFYFEEDVARATADAGMRALCGQTVLKFPSPDAGSFEDSLAMARGFIERWKGHPLIIPAPAPHAPYTCTAEILRACTELALDHDVPLHIHISETALEVENSRREHGMPVVPWVKKQGLLEAKVLAAHCVHVDDGELRTFKHYNTGISHNPSSNLKLASGFAPVTKMLDLGLNVGIGTDGPASNNDLDMFEEVRLAAFLAKSTTNDPTALPARQALTMATRLGAQAMHIGHLTGSLEPGKRADLILVDLNQLHNLPHFTHDPDAVYARLVYAAHSHDVTDVMVNGRWLMRDRKLLTLNEEELLYAADGYARRIDQFLIEREGSVLRKLVAIGGAEQGESFEVQVKAKLTDDTQVVSVMEGKAVTMIRPRHYHQYDTYFLFADPAQGRLRYREDEFLGPDGKSQQMRARLTLTGPAKEDAFESVVLSRSRFIAPATYSLRFYREYFNPTGERTIEKDRRRWLIAFHGVEFFVNLDRLIKPAGDGFYVEIKARTWSRRDAKEKAIVMHELLALFGVTPDQIVTDDYTELVSGD
ncbi:MAG: amidohydrolase family protein [Anaerolineales bacterium]|nr:amidohydrolase family protein [Anaerolineales bacterium]